MNRYKTLILAASFALGILATGVLDQQAAETTVRDTQIAQAVVQEISADRGVRSEGLIAVSAEGVVTLTGVVDSLTDKRRAADLATTCRGVRAVVNRLRIRSTDLDDIEIEQRVAIALAKDPATDSWDISVQVDDGVAMLTGRVDSFAEKVFGEQITADVHGVRQVHNKIKVKDTVERPDAEIKVEIERRLKYDIWLDDPKITVIVQRGLVLLVGTVGSEPERQRAQHDAWVAGVKTVDASRITIREQAARKLRRYRPHVPGNDHEILLAIKSALKYDPRVDAMSIHAKVDSGVVTLGGAVDNLRAKQAAVADARNALGVWEVVDEIAVREDKPRPAAELKETLLGAFSRDAYLNGLDIEPIVDGGSVKLEGSVNSEFEKRHADDVAAGIVGVVEVDNNLDVEAPVAVPADSLMQRHIENQLYWNPFIDDDQIEVTVHAGRVHLGGFVDSPNAFEIATEIAMEAGAARVVNDLQVRKK